MCLLNSSLLIHRNARAVNYISLLGGTIPCKWIIFLMGWERRYDDKRKSNRVELLFVKFYAVFVCAPQNILFFLLFIARTGWVKNCEKRDFGWNIRLSPWLCHLKYPIDSIQLKCTLRTSRIFVALYLAALSTLCFGVPMQRHVQLFIVVVSQLSSERWVDFSWHIVLYQNEYQISQ